MLLRTLAQLSLVLPSHKYKAFIIMPLHKDISKLKHPNSRKTSALSKQIKRNANKQKRKQQRGGTVEKKIFMDKLQWFKDNIDKSITTQYTVETHIALINTYLQRFDEELEQIKLKRSIGNHRQQQHANREDAINLTLNREREEFNTCGLEVPDLQNHQQYQLLSKWNGDVNQFPLFKLKRVKSNQINSR